MRTMSLVIMLCIANFSSAQEPPKAKDAGKVKLRLLRRYGYELEPRLYPQTMPKDTLESIIKAIIDQRFDYVMSHLADPGYVDAKVAVYKKDIAGSDQAKASLAFARLVKETINLYFEDAERIAELRLFARAADWKIDDDRAVGSLKQLPGRQVYLIRLEDRWFLQNRPAKEK